MTDTKDTLAEKLSVLARSAAGSDLVHADEHGRAAADAIDARIDILARSLLGQFVGDFEKMIDERARAILAADVAETFVQNARDVLKPGEELPPSISVGTDFHMVIPVAGEPARTTACDILLAVNQGLHLTTDWRDVTCAQCRKRDARYPAAPIVPPRSAFGPVGSPARTPDPAGANGPSGPASMPTAPSKLLIALDFDRVVHKALSKWTTAHDVNDDPVDGAFDFIRGALDGGFGVVLHTARARTDSTVPRIYSWLRAHGLEEKYCWQVEITALKPAAHVYIDDAAWRFDGRWPSLDEIRALRPWNDPNAPDTNLHHVSGGPTDRIPDCVRVSGDDINLLKVASMRLTDNWLQVTCPKCKALQPKPVPRAGRNERVAEFLKSDESRLVFTEENEPSAAEMLERANAEIARLNAYATSVENKLIAAKDVPEETLKQRLDTLVAETFKATGAYLGLRDGESLLDAAMRVVDARTKAENALAAFRGYDEPSSTIDLGLAYVLLDWMKGTDRTHGALGHAAVAYLRRNREKVLEAIKIKDDGRDAL